MRGDEVFIVRDHAVPLPRDDRTLEIRAEGLWAEPTCETPLEHWSIGLEAFGVRLDDPAQAYHGEHGDRIGVGLDLEWEGSAAVFPYQLMTRYEQSSAVHGEILLGDERVAFDGLGQRDHSWGVAQLVGHRVVLDGGRARRWNAVPRHGHAEHLAPGLHRFARGQAGRSRPVHGRDGSRS